MSEDKIRKTLFMYKKILDQVEIISRIKNIPMVELYKELIELGISNRPEYQAAIDDYRKLLEKHQ